MTMTTQQGLEQIGINRLQQARQHWQKGLEQITATTAFTWHSSKPARNAIATYAKATTIKLGLMALVELDLWIKASITRLEGMGTITASADPKAASTLDGGMGTNNEGLDQIGTRIDQKPDPDRLKGLDQTMTFDIDALKRAAHPGVSELNGTHNDPDGAGSQGMTNDPQHGATTRRHPQSTMDHGDGFEEDAAAAWAETE